MNRVMEADLASKNGRAGTRWTRADHRTHGGDLEAVFESRSYLGGAGRTRSPVANL